MKLTDLVYLSYTHPSHGRLPITDEIPKGVTVDEKAGTWSFEGRARRINDQMRRCEWGSHYGPIGVYDRTDVKNLNWMLQHAKDATQQPVSIALSD